MIGRRAEGWMPATLGGGDIIGWGQLGLHLWKVGTVSRCGINSASGSCGIFQEHALVKGACFPVLAEVAKEVAKEEVDDSFSKEGWLDRVGRLSTAVRIAGPKRHRFRQSGSFTAGNPNSNFSVAHPAPSGNMVESSFAIRTSS